MRQNKFERVAKPLALLTAGALMLISAGAAKASIPTVTITDDGGLHGAITQFATFSTQLTATVQGAPQPTSEIDVKGPTFEWSTSGAGLKLSSNTGNPNNLQSSMPPDYGGGGEKIATVRCTATFTRKNIADNTMLSPIVSSVGIKEVKFFVRVPTKVVSNGDPTHTAYTGQYRSWSDVGWKYTWGYNDSYPLKIVDNQGTASREAQNYGEGLPREEMTPNKQPDEGSDYTWGLDRVSGTGSPSSTFTDNLTGMERIDDPALRTWPLNESTTPVETLSQAWHCMELMPPYTGPQLYVTPNKFGSSARPWPLSGDFLPKVNDTTLNTDILKLYNYRSERN